MRLYVIRHGETAWNKARRLQGRHGADLNEEGILLAEMTAEALTDTHFDRCYTSPLLRAKHTAEIIMQGRQVPLIEDDRLQEISFGEWEGKCCDLTRLEIPRDRYLDFHERPFAYEPPSGGERIVDVIERAQSLFRELEQNPDLQNETILISTHGCCTRAFLHSLYENKEDYWQGGVPMNCAVTIVESINGQSRILESDKVFYGPEYQHNYYQMQRDAERKGLTNENK